MPRRARRAVDLGDLLAARADQVLVTGDKLLLEDPGMEGRIVAPQAFVAGMEPSR